MIIIIKSIKIMMKVNTINVKMIWMIKNVAVAAAVAAQALWAHRENQGRRESRAKQGQMVNQLMRWQ